MKGVWPDQEIDHANRDRSDNRWVNLREASPSQNRMNRGKQRNSASGIKGVHWASHARRWRADVTFKGRRHRLGYFDTREAAAAAYEAAAHRLAGEFARA
jgi:hypothetical protein